MRYKVLKFILCLTVFTFIQSITSFASPHWKWVTGADGRRIYLNAEGQQKLQATLTSNRYGFNEDRYNEIIKEDSSSSDEFKYYLTGWWSIPNNGIYLFKDNGLVTTDPHTEQIGERSFNVSFDSTGKLLGKDGTIIYELTVIDNTPYSPSYRGEGTVNALWRTDVDQTTSEYGNLIDNLFRGHFKGTYKSKINKKVTYNGYDIYLGAETAVCNTFVCAVVSQALHHIFHAGDDPNFYFDTKNAQSHLESKGYSVINISKVSDFKVGDVLLAPSEHLGIIRNVDEINELVKVYNKSQSNLNDIEAKITLSGNRIQFRSLKTGNASTGMGKLLYMVLRRDY